MRACQMCGCKSWGPEKTPHPEKGQLLGPFLECDGCGALAREDLIQELSFNSIGGGFTPPPMPPMFDVIGNAREAIRGIVPEKAPETRLERLVRELLAREGMDTSPKQLITHALEIDNELTSVEMQVSAAGHAGLKPRNFVTDFLHPAIDSSAPVTTQRISLALDCAVAFGALEALTGNDSLSKVPELDRAYWEKVVRLKALVSG